MTLKYKDYIIVGNPSEIKDFIDKMELNPLIKQNQSINEAKPSIEINEFDDTISKINSIDRYKLPDDYNIEDFLRKETE